VTATVGNLFAGVAQKLADEQVVELLAARNIRIERIVSTGHASPPGFWYDQDWAEWVLLVAGSAGLLFEGDAEPVGLEPGSYVHIGARQRHRIAWTDPNAPTIWLAIHHR
jgi:cupin 2 domain-containing protein